MVQYSENNITLDIRSGSYCIYHTDTLEVIDSGEIEKFGSFEAMSITAKSNYMVAQWTNK